MVLRCFDTLHRPSWYRCSEAAMRRDVLNQFLLAGPRAGSTCFSWPYPAGGAGRSAPFLQQLEQHHLFKSADRDRKTGEDDKTVATLIYLPYDEHRPGDGGESLVFSEHAFLNLCHNNGAQGPDGPRAVEADLAKLRLLDCYRPSVGSSSNSRSTRPTFRSPLPTTAHTRNAEQTDGAPVEQPLIVAAHKRTACVIDHAVEELTAKLFSLRERPPSCR